MQYDSRKLQSRLLRLWEPPDFFNIFAKYATHSPHVVKKRTVLFNQGDPLTFLYFINKGFVKLYQVSEEGRETIIYLSCPGDVLGLRSLTSKSATAHHFGETLTEAVISYISHKDFFKVASHHPELLVDFMHIFIKRLNHAERRLEGYITTDTTTRVASFLYDCADRFGKKDTNGITLPLPLTHQRISEFVGAFRETVTIALHRLEEDKVLETKRGNIIILDMKKLYRHANPHKTL